MAFTAAKYMYESTVIGFTEFSMDIVDMEMVSPVVVELSGDQKPDCIRLIVKMIPKKMLVSFDSKPAATCQRKMLQKSTPSAL